LIPGSGLHVSVSHSADRVAVALTRLGPVGVDVEEIGDLDPDELAPLVLGPGERAEASREFFTYWTRKEAAVKATGDGLRVPLRDVRVSGPHEAARLISYPGRPGWEMTLTDLRPGIGYAGALAVLSTVPPHVDERDAGILLARSTCGDT
jgi:4'-phosphopantetheinyl transferase